MTEESPPLLNKAARRGYSVNYKNKNLLSAIDPVEQAERVVNSAGTLDRTLYFCISPLLGYGLETLLSLIASDSAVLCVETDDKLFELSKKSIDKQILNHPRVALTKIKDSEALCGFVRETWGPRSFRRVELLKLSGGWQCDSDHYALMEKTLRSAIAIDWGNAMTLVKLGRRFMYNVLRNIACLNKARPLTELSFGEKPVLVLGAGPSLDPLLDSLQKAGIFEFHHDTEKKAERRFALICVDSCLTALRERKIIPDLAVILESQFWNLRDFSGSRNSGIPAAVDLSAYPGTVDLLGGPLYFFLTPWTPLRFFERFLAAGFKLHVLPPLGSVGLTAVELALRSGTGPVLTGGIDFSYTVDSFHARSSPSHLAMLQSINRFGSLINAQAAFRSGVFNTVSKTKNAVKSDPAMRTYRDLFEKEFSGGRVKDITGNGLPLGLELLGIDDAVKILKNSAEKTGSQKTGAFYNSGNLAKFIKSEEQLLEGLRGLLTGSLSANNDVQLETLLDKADYLWAHFPDCAGAEGRRPPASDLVFLKRVRAEIDPFIKLWKLAEKEMN